ncbi:hypothetical protein [Kitasatospora cineracea]|uniref:hypothetical protein n=1 Tax=Kitasatospora cineracea TaxID=88074 RepID=UPI0033DB7FFB
MYLVHATFAATSNAMWPSDTADLFVNVADGAAWLHHATVHPLAGGGAVVGMFVTAPNVAEAERSVADLCELILLSVPALGDFHLVRVESPLHMAAEHGQIMPRTDAARHDPFQPF